MCINNYLVLKMLIGVQKCLRTMLWMQSISNATQCATGIAQCILRVFHLRVFLSLSPYGLLFSLPYFLHKQTGKNGSRLLMSEMQFCVRFNCITSRFLLDVIVHVLRFVFVWLSLDWQSKVTNKLHLIRTRNSSFMSGSHLAAYVVLNAKPCSHCDTGREWQKMANNWQKNRTIVKRTTRNGFCNKQLSHSRQRITQFLFYSS